MGVSDKFRRDSREFFGAAKGVSGMIQRNFKAYQSFSEAFRMVMRGIPRDSGDFQGSFRGFSDAFQNVSGFQVISGIHPLERNWCHMERLGTSLERQ